MKFPTILSLQPIHSYSEELPLIRFRIHVGNQSVETGHLFIWDKINGVSPMRTAVGQHLRQSGADKTGPFWHMDNQPSCISKNDGNLSFIVGFSRKMKEARMCNFISAKENNYLYSITRDNHGFSLEKPIFFIKLWFHGFCCFLFHSLFPRICTTEVPYVFNTYVLPEYNLCIWIILQSQKIFEKCLLFYELCVTILPSSSNKDTCVYCEDNQGGLNYEKDD